MAELSHLSVGWVGLLPLLCVPSSFHVSWMACFSVYITDAPFWNCEIWWQRSYLIYLTRAVDRMKHLLAKDVIHFLHWKQKVFLFLLLIWPMFIPQHCAPKKRQTSKKNGDRMEPNFLTPGCSSYSTFFSSFILHGHQNHLIIGIISWYLVYFFHFFFFGQRCIFSLYNFKILSHVWSPKIKIGLYWNEW